MLKNFFKVTFRSLIKNRLFVIINTLGLGITLACCIIAYLNFKFNADFDEVHENANEIYRVNFVRITNGNPIKNGSSPGPLGNLMRESFSQVDKVIRYYPGGGNFKVGDDLFRIGVSAVEEEWFNVFSFEMIYGSSDGLKDRSTIFLNEETAEKFFPGINPVGEVIKYVNNDKELEFKVGGVYRKPPVNSSFQNDSFVNYDVIEEIFDINYNDDWSLFTTTFVTVKNPENIPAINKNLQQYVEIQNRAKEDYKVAEYYLDPFVGMAERAEREDIWNHWFWSAMPAPAVDAPAIMAILILLIACFNFTNTSIAIANRRLKEIGLRKVMGSSRKMMIVQFLGENMILAFIGLLLGLLIAWFLVPAYSNMWAFLEIKMDFSVNIGFYIFLLVLLLFTGFVAGSYPAFFVTSFQPTNILRGTLKYGGTSRFTKVLLTMQYSISILAIVSGLLFTRNARFQEEFDMGFIRQGMVYAFVENEDDFNLFKNEIENNAKIKNIAGSRHNITSSWYTDPIKFEENELDVDLLDVGDNYLNTVGATIVAGRDFIKDSQSDVEESVIVNEELVRTFGWKDPIGQRLVLRDTVQLFVVGVVKDMYLRALWDPVRPSLIRYTKPDGYRFIAAQMDVKDAKEVHDFMDEKWKEVFPDKLTTVRYIDENLEETATVNGNIKIIFVFLAIVAVLLSASGLYSLVTLNIIKRMKEIGVRKVLGAKVSNIAFIVNKSFIIMLLIASVFGSIAAYFLTDSLMASIWAYYTDMAPDTFILALVIMFLVSSITVGQKVIAAARTNPVNTLRNE
jgi:ABC-type antimicrobial peptide transport system permease subunit